MDFRRYTLQGLRSSLREMLIILQVISACFMVWKAFSLWADTPFPVTVVISESMEPAFRRGDVMLVTNHHDQTVKVGDLPVCWFPERPFPMVHRVIQIFHQEHEDPDLRYIHPYTSRVSSMLIRDVQTTYPDQRGQ